MKTPSSVSYTHLAGGEGYFPGVSGAAREERFFFRLAAAVCVASLSDSVNLSTACVRDLYIFFLVVPIVLIALQVPFIEDFVSGSAFSNVFYSNNIILHFISGSVPL